MTVSRYNPLISLTFHFDLQDFSHSDPAYSAQPKLLLNIINMIIPADIKDVKGPIPDSTEHNENARSAHPDTLPPPPSYEESVVGPISEDGRSSSSFPPPPSHTSSSRSAPLSPGYRAPLAPPEKVPQSGGLNASNPIKLEGPLYIDGAAKSSSTIQLRKFVTVDGKVDSSSNVTLSDDVVVTGKVDSSSTVKLRNNVNVLGKVDASGSIE